MMMNAADTVATSLSRGQGYPTNNLEKIYQYKESCSSGILLPQSSTHVGSEQVKTPGIALAAASLELQTVYVVI